jgi:hypothetical protein
MGASIGVRISFCVAHDCKPNYSFPNCLSDHPFTLCVSYFSPKCTAHKRSTYRKF